MLFSVDKEFNIQEKEEKNIFLEKILFQKKR